MKNIKPLSEIEYNLELERVANTIKKQKAKRVLIQLPDGLKQYATQIVDELKNKFKIKSDIFIWLDSCYGACDIPIAESEKLKIDLIVQFGHSAWDFGKK